MNRRLRVMAALTLAAFALLMLLVLREAWRGTHGFF